MIINVEYSDRINFLDIINKLDLKVGCEVGVFRGKFTLEILKRSNLKKLYLIDPWEHLSNYNDSMSKLNNNEFEEIFQDVKTKLIDFQDRVEFKRVLSERAVLDFDDNSLDFVYIDANHSYDSSKFDIENWYKKIRIGGVLSGHDYLNGTYLGSDYGVERSVNEFVTNNKLQLNITAEMYWKTWFIIKK